MRSPPPKKPSRGLVIPVHTGGSGMGLTTYESILECPRRYWLDRQLAEKGLPTSSDNEHTMMGTCGHGLLGKYYTKGQRFVLDNVVYKDVAGGEWSPPAKSMFRAQRLVRHYMAKYPPDEFTVVAVEKLYSVWDAPWKPKGVRLTAQIDLEIKLTKTQATKMGAKRHLLLEPGYYILDHKFHTQNRSDLNDRHVMSLQLEGYGLIWQHEHPRRKLQGRLVNMLIDGSTPRFRMLFLPPPDEASEARVRNLLQVASQSILQEPPEARGNACVSKWGEICAHYSAGRCLRY